MHAGFFDEEGCLSAPSPGFLDLPSELRIKICGHLLVASEPIIVCSLTSKKEVLHALGNVSLRSCGSANIVPAVLGRLTLGLLECNRQISREAAFTFYRWNTFRFAGESTWGPLYAFLQIIGENNRRSLRSLELDIPMPERLRQYSDGTCTTLNPWCVRKVVVRPASLQNTFSSWNEDFVDDLDPAIEPCFRILGKNRPSLTFRLKLRIHYLPGLDVTGDEYDEGFRWGWELPIMIGKYISELTSSGSAENLVDVLWHGELEREDFLRQQQRLLDCGWIIVDLKESSYTVDHGKFTRLTLLLTLRWRSS